MIYKINPNIQHRSESFGGIAEGYSFGLKIFTTSEYRKFLSFEKPLFITKKKASTDSFFKELIDTELLVEA